MKQIIYIFLWVVLGILLSYLAHAGLEIAFIKYLLTNGQVPINYGSFGGYYCALSLWIQIALITAGAIGGLGAGRFFYRVIYIEKRIKKCK